MHCTKVTKPPGKVSPGNARTTAVRPLPQQTDDCRVPSPPRDLACQEAGEPFGSIDHLEVRNGGSWADHGNGRITLYPN